MGFFVKFKEKTKISDTLCCWCYEISRNDGEKFKRGEIWGLSLPKEIKTQDPIKYAKCNGYKRGAKESKRDWPDHGYDAAERTHWVPNVTVKADTEKFELCFIAPCEETLKAAVGLVRWKLDENSKPDDPRGDWVQETVTGGDEVLGPATTTP